MSGFSKKSEAGEVLVRGPGAALGAARTAKGLDLHKTAKMLHLTREVVESLEKDDYENLPARVFIRGYLRNFARLVDLSETQILSEFDKLCPDEGCSKALPAITRGVRTEVRSSHGVVRLVTWLIVLGIIASVVISWQDNIGDAWDKIQDLGKNVEQQGNVDEGQLLIPVIAEEPEILRAADPQQPTPVETFVIHFSGPTWVDIKDSQGAFNLTGDMSGGSSKILQGSPPFTVMLSDYKQVAITVDDEPYDIGQHLDNLDSAESLYLQFVIEAK